MRYEAKNQVFVAMPFTASFQRAYDSVIEPAIKLVTANGKELTPRIINRATSGSPDIHEQIFDAILHSRLVIADMTVQSKYMTDSGSTRWQANANVAYEVGLACAWRNPEDVLLIYQGHSEHSYSFDVQNLRHVEYDPSDSASVKSLADEIVRALNQSSFLAKVAYQKIIESISPSSIQYMEQEARRAFPMIVFNDPGMPIMDTRIHAITELLSYGALRNRNVVRQGSDRGVAVIYEWTELGLRMLLSMRSITEQRLRELRTQIASVAAGDIPPPELRDLPDAAPPAQASTDVIAAAKVDPANEATSSQ
jgi:hypothetical protein